MGNTSSLDTFNGIGDDQKFKKYDQVKIDTSRIDEFKKDDLWGPMLDNVVKDSKSVILTGFDGTSYQGFFDAGDKYTKCYVKEDWVIEASDPDPDIVVAVKMYEGSVRERLGRERKAASKPKMSILERLDRIERALGLDE